mmetsp:Transcript_19375/g.46660  ORF Transcript_19375/g.46660 Transcript_19375/m.46660 type:complete len:353 (+) Transcript_19375:81-1139(+)
MADAARPKITPADGAKKPKAKAQAQGKSRDSSKKSQGKRPAPKKAQKKKKASKRVQETVDATFEISETARHAGVVEFFDSRRGYGFLKPSQEDLVPTEKLMVHWKDIQTDDAWPHLKVEMAVEFSVEKKLVQKETKAILRAVNVTLPGGGKVAIQAQEESAREWVGSKTQRYAGVVQWYNTRMGYGVANLSTAVGEITEVKLGREEIAGDGTVPLSKDLTVEFSMYKDAEGAANGANVTLPGGKIVTRDIAEGREVYGTTTYVGEVSWYQPRSGIGFILPEDFDALPAPVQAKSTEAAQKKANQTQKEAFEGLTFRKRDLSAEDMELPDGTRVKFTVYTDNRGAGAKDIVLA